MSDEKTAHYIITRIFNNSFNGFIAFKNKRKELYVTITNGAKEFHVYSYHLFHGPASKLDSLRSEFYSNYGSKEELTRNDIKNFMKDFLSLYSNVASYEGITESQRDFILTNLINSGDDFCKEVDEIFGFKKYQKEIEGIPILLSYVSDYEFAKQHIDKASEFKGKTQKEVEEKYAEGDKETIEAVKDFAEETYVNIDNAKIKKAKSVNVIVKIELDGSSFQTKFKLKKVNETEIYPIGEYTTNSKGEYTKKLFKGTYIVEVENEAGEFLKEEFEIEETDSTRVIKVELEDVEEKVPFIKKLLCKLGIHSLKEYYANKYKCEYCGKIKEKRK
jgi:hypothetical protein